MAKPRCDTFESVFTNMPQRAPRNCSSRKCLEAARARFRVKVMKKVFPLTAPGKADARVVESVKHEIRKYVKRERRKPVPAEFEQWDFACRVGTSQATAESSNLRDVGTAIDAVAAAGTGAVYVEITAIPSRRTPLERSAVSSPASERPLVNSADRVS